MLANKKKPTPESTYKELFSCAKQSITYYRTCLNKFQTHLEIHLVSNYLQYTDKTRTFFKDVDDLERVLSQIDVRKQLEDNRENLGKLHKKYLIYKQWKYPNWEVQLRLSEKIQMKRYNFDTNQLEDWIWTDKVYVIWTWNTKMESYILFSLYPKWINPRFANMGSKK